jgi:hypothetical protein
MVAGSDFKELWGSGEPPATRMAGRRAARRGRPPSGLGWPRLVLTAANRAAVTQQGALGLVGARFGAAFIGARRRARLPRMAAAARPAARSGPDGLCRAWPAGPARAQAGWVGPLVGPIR